MSNIEIKYLDPDKLLVIEASGKIKQLYVPIKGKTNQPLSNKIPGETLIYIEEIRACKEFKLLFRVFNNWYPYWSFSIK
jgi:hypothetical protein